MATLDDLAQSIQTIENELGLNPEGIYSSVRTRLDILEARINNPFAPAPNVQNPFFIGDSGVTISVGSGSPTENRIAGSLYLRVDGYAYQGLYVSRPDGYWHQINTDLGINRNIHSAIVNAVSPFTASLLDDFIPVDTTTGAVTILLPSSPTTGKGYTIVDQTGSAALNNITVLGNGYNINGTSSFVIDSNYQTINVVFTGISWTKF